jgi:DNA modification methylase
MVELLHGDCLERLQELPDCSVDACVTDPPYGLSFMGKKWDYDVPGEDIWRECLRVLKPGGHLLAFAGTRTQHRMAVRIEDAGFEIRDMIAWVYGQGFPKSLDVSKAIDKAAGTEREVTGTMGKCGMATAAENYENNKKWSGLRRDTPATPEAQQWDGWGTALKPALEPITVARKPFKGTVAANVLEHGTGAINIDGCRVGTEERFNLAAGNKAGGNSLNMSAVGMPDADGKTCVGRWPANLIHDGSDEVTELFGDVQRFFYCAKASKADRSEGNTHPTVKPTDLMRYLCRLVTPPGGIVLDPFMGSGSTGKAAMLDGFRFIGIERDPTYFESARRRLQMTAHYQEDLF